MKIGKQFGCSFDDKIDLEFCPSDLEDIIYLVEEQSLKFGLTYAEQGLWRRYKDYMQSRFDEWRKLRNKKDK